MNEDEQRIAIAKYCDWKYEWVGRHHIYANRRDEGWQLMSPGGDMVGGILCGISGISRVDFENLNPTLKSARCSSDLPDYLNDLNACHEMEETLTDSLCQIHFGNLKEATGAELSTNGVPYGVNYFCLYHATASQRCEAFLKTIGKWKEAQE